MAGPGGLATSGVIDSGAWPVARASKLLLKPTVVTTIRPTPSCSSTASCRGWRSTSACSRRRATPRCRSTSGSSSSASSRRTSTSSSWSASPASSSRSLGKVAETPADGMTAGRAARGHQPSARTRWSAEQDRIWQEELSAGAGRGGHPSARAAGARRRAARRRARPLRQRGLPGADAAGGRPRPSVPAPAQQVAQHRGAAAPASKAQARRGREPLLAVVQVPTVLGRAGAAAVGERGQLSFALLDDAHRPHVGDLFPGYTRARAARLPRHAQLGPARRRGRVRGSARRRSRRSCAAASAAPPCASRSRRHARRGRQASLTLGAQARAGRRLPGRRARCSSRT